VLHPLIRFGTSSFSEKSWVGPFYPPRTPPGDFLRVYAGRYDTVEIDATYYAVPPPRTVAGWEAKTPEGFLISAKFPKDIVHGGEGKEPDPAKVLDPDATYPIRDEFLEVMRALGPKRGPLVLQFPFFSRSVFPHRGPFLERLDRFLADVPPDARIAVEVRNGAWIDGELASILRRHGAALVLVDMERMPDAHEVARRLDPVTASFAYVRLLGERRRIEALTLSWETEVIDRSREIRLWAEFLGRWLERRVPTLVYANNHYAGHAPATVERLRRTLAEITGPEALGGRVDWGPILLDPSRPPGSS
jgi:uncharacterized protein YecE (DUF72 family)